MPDTTSLETISSDDQGETVRLTKGINSYYDENGKKIHVDIDGWREEHEWGCIEVPCTITVAEASNKESDEKWEITKNDVVGVVTVAEFLRPVIVRIIEDRIKKGVDAEQLVEAIEEERDNTFNYE
jgi:hypothetical protein